LDTNVVSENVRPNPDRSAAAWLAQRAPEQTAISIVTLAELHMGALATDNAHRRREVSRWIEREIMGSFGERILPITLDILIDWLQLGQRTSSRGRRRAPADLLIAATARVHDLIVATRNGRDFADTGVIVYDPWTGKTHQMEEP
jgi:predicted nucleic acid-binding protein